MDKDNIQKLADLARIKVPSGEEEGLLSDINSILDYVEKVQDVVVDADPTKEVGIPHNVMRDDEEPHAREAYTKEILSEAPETEGQYIKVKKIL